MKKSTIILISFIVILFILQFSIIFNVKSEIRDAEYTTYSTLEKQKLSEAVNRLEIKDNIVAYISQDNENWIEINDTIYSQEVKGNCLCIVENIEPSDFDGKTNNPFLKIGLESLNNIVAKDNAKLFVEEGILSDTLKLFAWGNGVVNLKDVEAKLISIECYSNSFVYISNVTCDGLEILASDNSRVIITGDINYAKGAINNNASLKIPSVGKSNFSKSDSASISMH